MNFETNFYQKFFDLLFIKAMNPNRNGPSEEKAITTLTFDNFLKMANTVKPVNNVHLKDPKMKVIVDRLSLFKGRIGISE